MLSAKLHDRSCHGKIFARTSWGPRMSGLELRRTGEGRKLPCEWRQLWKGAHGRRIDDGADTSCSKGKRPGPRSLNRHCSRKSTSHRLKTMRNHAGETAAQGRTGVRLQNEVSECLDVNFHVLLITFSANDPHVIENEVPIS